MPTVYLKPTHMGAVLSEIKSSISAPFTRLCKKYIKYITIAMLFLPAVIMAAEDKGGSSEHQAAALFLGIAVLLIAAKISSLVEKIGQPSVLGELVMGVILGNLGLLGIHYFDALKANEIIQFLAELGVVILLFQIGLESNIYEMKKVGLNSFFVAVIGVVLPFVLGTYIVGPWLLPGLSTKAYLFIGASLTATSVGITARVFKDLGKLQTPEARIVLGAAVFDDVMGLIILAIVSAIATMGAVSLGTISWITAKAVLFLVGSIVVGILIAPYLGRFFSKIHTGVGMKLTLAISFGLIFAYLAGVIGLAPIVGAFAAGLVLDPVHFRYFKNHHLVEDIKKDIDDLEEDKKKKINNVIESYSHRHIEDLIEPISVFLVPLFFIVTGMAVNIKVLFNGQVLLVALGVTIAAFLGKILAGLAAGKVKKALVGWGMVPRGEVGLIFATIGKQLGVINDAVFSVIIIMVIITTLITPPVITNILKKY